MFEYLKAQGYYRFVTWYYGALSDDVVVLLSRRRPPDRQAKMLPMRSPAFRAPKRFR